MRRAAIFAVAAAACFVTSFRAEGQGSVDRLLREGTEARQAGRFEEAVERLTRASQAEPDNADILVQLGLALSAQKRFDDAKVPLRKALERAPAYGDARLGLARIAFFEGRLDEAERELAAFRERTPASPEADALAGQIAAARSESTKHAAAPELKGSQGPASPDTAARSEPKKSGPTPESKTGQASQATEAERLRRDGAAAYKAGRIPRAIELLTKAKGLDADNADILVQLGAALSAAKRYDDAARSFRRALELAPTYADARVGLARLAFFRGELDQAERELSPVLAKGATSAEARALQAQIEKARAAVKARSVAGQSSGQERRENVAARKRATDFAASLDRALGLRRSGRFVEAEALYRAALKERPDDAELWVSAGLVAAFQGESRFADARRDFGRALALNPRSVDAELGLARVDLYAGALDEAETRVAGVLARQPDLAEARALAARIRLAQGDGPGAEVAFRRLAALNGRDVETLIGLGDALRAQLRDGEAKIVYARAANLDPASSEAAERLKMRPRPRWRLDLDGSYSTLNQGNKPWREGSARLAYDLGLRTTISAGVEVSHRFGKTDTLVDARIDQRFGDRWTGYLRYGGAPEANFRPRYFVETGGSVRLWAGSGAVGPTLATLDLGFARYPSADVAKASPGVQQYFLDGRLWLTGKLIGTVAEQSVLERGDAFSFVRQKTDYLGGYSVRADVKPAEWVTLFIGYADAPDASDGRVFQAKSIFGGATLDVNDWVSLKLAAAHERRVNSYNRTSVNMGVTTRF